MSGARKKRINPGQPVTDVVPMNGDVAAFAPSTSGSSSSYSPQLATSATSVMSSSSSSSQASGTNDPTSNSALTTSTSTSSSTTSSSTSGSSSSETVKDVYAEARASGHTRRSLTHRARAMDAYNNQSITSRSRLLARESSRLANSNDLYGGGRGGSGGGGTTGNSSDDTPSGSGSGASSRAGSVSGSTSSRCSSTTLRQQSSRGSMNDLFGIPGNNDTDELIEEMSETVYSRVLAADEILLLEAVIVLWHKQRLAMAMRRWAQVCNSFSDPEVLMQTHDIKTESRQLFLQNEKKKIYDPTHPREFSRQELDICLAWAKLMQTKTFQGVDDPSIQEVVQCLRFRHYEDGQVLFFEGDVGNTFYIVFNGTVAVYVGLNKSSSEYKARKADVVAAVTMGATHVQMMRQASQRALNRSPSSRKNLVAVKQQPSLRNGMAKGPPNASPTDANGMGGSMRSLPTGLQSTRTLLNHMSSQQILEDQELGEHEKKSTETVAAAAATAQEEKKEEDPSDYYFVCSVVSEPVPTERRFLGKRVYTYRTGESFGETVMFTSDAIRTASAVAIGPCDICEVSREVYKRTLRKFHQEFFEQAQRVNFLQRVTIFSDWPRNRLALIAQKVRKIKLNFGNHLLVENVDGIDTGFFILSGHVKILHQLNLPSLAGSGMELSKDEDGNPLTNSLGNIVRGGFGLRRFGKQQHRILMQMEVDLLGPGEIVCIESFLTPAQTMASTNANVMATGLASTGASASAAGGNGGIGGGGTLSPNGLATNNSTFGGMVTNSSSSSSSAATGGASAHAPKIAYTVQAASAVVELYALADSDARSFFASAPTSFSRQMQRIARDQYQRRHHRLESSTRAIMDQQKHNFEAKRFVETLNAAQRSEDILTSAIILQELNLSMPIGVLPCSESPRMSPTKPISPTSSSTLGQTAVCASPSVAPVQPQVSATPSKTRPVIGAIKKDPEDLPKVAALLAKTPSTLYVDTTASTSMAKQATATTMLSSNPMQTATSPRMLSTCAKKFVFEHSHALEPRFVEHFKTQFPGETNTAIKTPPTGTLPANPAPDTVFPTAIAMEAATVVSNSLAPAAIPAGGTLQNPPVPGSSSTWGTNSLYSPRSPVHNVQITTLLHPSSAITSPLSHHRAQFRKSEPALSCMEQDVFVIKSRMEQAEYYQVLQQQFKSVVDRKTIQFDAQTTPFSHVQPNTCTNSNDDNSQSSLSQRVHQTCPLLHHHQQRHVFPTKNIEPSSSRATDLSTTTTIPTNYSVNGFGGGSPARNSTAHKSAGSRSPTRPFAVASSRGPSRVDQHLQPQEEEVLGLATMSRLHQKPSHQNNNAKRKPSAYTSTARKIIQSHFKKINGQDRSTTNGSSEASDHDGSNFVHFF